MQQFHVQDFLVFNKSTPNKKSSENLDKSYGQAANLQDLVKSKIKQF